MAWVQSPVYSGRIICVSIIQAYAMRLKSWAVTESLTVSSLNYDLLLILGLETLSISRCFNH